MRVGVIGASGYTGAELLRILWGHPRFHVTLATASGYAGWEVGRLYPGLRKYYPGEFVPYRLSDVDSECDVVFMGLPHGESMKSMPEILSLGKKVVDLSADFRLEDPGVYREWYDLEHCAPQYLSKAVYGLPEVRREEIRGCELVANPGCYPTGALLGLFPLAESGSMGGRVIVDAKSGVSGAGRKPTLKTHFPQAADGVSPYGVGGHRHQPEIQAQLEGMGGGCKVTLVPHLSPMNRGILSTMYVNLAEPKDPEAIREVFEARYSAEPFLVLLEEGDCPDTKAVQGCNDCHVSVQVIDDVPLVVVMTAIDNLVKGAAGQAVQNMNLMCGFAEDTGLDAPGVFP